VPVVLIVDDQEWRARSFESLFGPQGFAVVKAYTGRQSAELAQRVDPDVVIAAHHLPCSGCDVIRAIRTRGPAGSATPCLIISATPLSRSERRACFESGAWDIATTPIDPPEILLKVRTYVDAKRRCDIASERGLLDTDTGCYNLRGLLRRLEELASDAARWHRAMACVVVGVGEDQAPNPEALTAAVKTLRSLLRSSDALGRLSQGELAVVAPGTDALGAQRLAERIAAGLVGAGDPLRIGVYAVAANDSSGVRGAPEEVLSRAVRALRNAQRLPNVANGNRISSFEV
jgi:PleD family two-component response regulator